MFKNLLTLFLVVAYIDVAFRGRFYRCIECRRGLAIRILSVRPSVCLSVCLSLRLSVCLSVRLSVRPSVCLSVCQTRGL